MGFQAKKCFSGTQYNKAEKPGRYIAGISVTTDKIPILSSICVVLAVRTVNFMLTVSNTYWKWFSAAS